MPLHNDTGQCVAVVQAVNKLMFVGPATATRPRPTSSADASITSFVREDQLVLERIGDIAGGILHRLQLESRAVRPWVLLLSLGVFPRHGRGHARVDVGFVWFHFVWFRFVWFRLVWFRLVSFGFVWFGFVWFGFVSFRLVSRVARMGADTLCPMRVPCGCAWRFSCVVSCMFVWWWPFLLLLFRQALLSQRTKVLVTLMRNVAEAPNTQEVIKTVIAATYKLVPAERVTLFMVDAKHEVCRARCFRASVSTAVGRRVLTFATLAG